MSDQPPNLPDAGQAEYHQQAQSPHRQHQPQAYPQQYPQAVQKKSNAWKWVLGILGTMFLLCGGGFAACTVISLGADDLRKSERADTCEGKTYANMQRGNDVCADAVGALTLNGVTVTATPLVRTDPVFVCTNVTIQNGSKETISFYSGDWDLQRPSGEIKEAISNPDNGLDTADLAPGGTTSGSICFSAPGGGDYVLIYKPGLFGDDRGVWPQNL